MANHEHEHQWGEIQVSRITGTPSRPCIAEGCRVVSLDLSDDCDCDCGSADCPECVEWYKRNGYLYDEEKGYYVEGPS